MALLTLRRAALTALVTLPGVSCAPPRIGPAREVPKAAAALLATASPLYAPSAAQVAATTAGERVRLAFQGPLTGAAKATLTHEPALDTVAAVLAEMAATDREVPSRALLQWLFWRAGAVSTPLRVATLTTNGTDDLELQTADLAAKVQAAVLPESFGIARSTSGRPAEVVVFARAPLTVTSFAKTFTPGASISLKVKPEDASTELEVVADVVEGGATEVERMAPAADGTYSLTRKAPDKPGRYILEITGLDARTLAAMPENPWRRSLFFAPIYVGVPEPPAPGLPPRNGSADSADSQAWGASIVDGYNAARTKAGKAPIVLDGRLTALAQERSGVVARSGRETAPDANLADKLAAAGHAPRDYDALDARVDSPSDYVLMRLLQPSARQRLMGDLVSVGVGLTPNAANAFGGVDYSLVEADVVAAPPFDGTKEAGRVVAALDALQKAEGRPAYMHDPDVAKVVQGFADEVCRGAKRANQMKPLIDKARGVGEKYRQWSTPTWRAGYDYTRWQEVSVLSKGKEPPLPYAEVGICQGDLPGKPGGSYVVVIQYGP